MNANNANRLREKILIIIGLIPLISHSLFLTLSSIDSIFNSSPFIPSYATSFVIFSNASLLIPLVLGCVGLLTLLFNKKAGWIPALLGSLTFLLWEIKLIIYGFSNGNISIMAFLYLAPILIGLFLLYDFGAKLNVTFKKYLIVWIGSFIFLLLNHFSLEIIQTCFH